MSNRTEKEEEEENARPYTNAHKHTCTHTGNCKCRRNCKPALDQTHADRTTYTSKEETRKIKQMKWHLTR